MDHLVEFICCSDNGRKNDEDHKAVENMLNSEGEKYQKQLTILKGETQVNGTT